MSEPSGMPRGYNAGVYVLSLAGLVGLWQVVVWIGVSPLLLPSPAGVARAMVEFANPIARATRATLVEVVLGFGLALFVGTTLAIGISYSRVLRAVIYPPVLLLHSLPKMALAPILLVWFGLGLASKVVVAFLIAFFPILIQTVAGLKDVDPELHELARSLHAPWFRTFRKIDVPHALPAVFAGLKVAITLAVAGAIVGEFLAADEGLGFLLASAGSQFQTELAFATLIVIAGMSMSLFGAVVLVERMIAPWSRGGRR